MIRLIVNRVIVALVTCAVLVAGGCASKLETGYMPRKLGGSEEMRRGYYAQPFTPQAKAAKQYERDFGESSPSRPRPGY